MSLFKRFALLFVVLTIYCPGIIPLVYGGLKIEISKGVMEPQPIALVIKGDEHLIKEMNSVIGGNLKNCGFFSLVDSQAFLQTPASVEQDGPRFTDWRAIKVRFLLCANVEQVGDQVKVRFRLYDVFSQTTMAGLEVSLNEAKRRNLFHMVADHVFERITNESPYFNSSIIFVEKLQEKGNPTRCLRHIKQDGHGIKDLTERNTLVMTPRISPDGAKIAFVSYESGRPRTYVLDVKNKTKKLLNNLEGMTYAPRWHPNNQDLVFSRTENGNSAIYKMNVNSGVIARLTSHNSIDTSACFSHDGAQIVFVSDREKENAAANLYVMDLEGQNVRRITFGEGSYYQPVWSPRGDMIAFIKRHKGQFYLGVIAPDGTEERLIASHYLVDSIDWAPNGRYLVYTKEEKPGKGQLMQIDVSGAMKVPISLPPGTKFKACDCTWGPLEGRLVVQGQSSDRRS